MATWLIYLPIFYDKWPRMDEQISLEINDCMH